ncbi:helix-turn-helix transcriptional regulator [Mesorhizobium sp. M0520]|uniref:helix-turn-helix domain-containing protein n=1 Tax=unclassified Mesorhizobium TaxID=325217 RepID=UPI003335D8F4
MVARIKLDEAPEAKIYLAEWRETKFPTQPALAEAMNTAPATVSRIETGERDWGKGYLEALAYLVGCQVPDLFYPPNVAPERPEAQDSFWPLFERLESLQGTERKRMRMLIEANLQFALAE